MRYGQPSDASVTRGFALCLLFAALSGACSSTHPRTQVMLIVDADSEVQALAKQLAVDIESRSEFDHIDGAPKSQQFLPMEEASTGWPFSIALLPQGNDARRSYRVTVTLSDANGAIARLRAHSGFVPQQTLALRLFFSADCLRAASLDCRDQETCLDGSCVNAQVDARDLLPLSGGIANGFSPGDAGWGDSMPRSSSRAPALMTGAKKGDAGMDAAGSGGSSKPPSDTPVPGDCGDGRLDPGELCDTAMAAGEVGGCPTACPVDNPCVPSQLEGSGCLTQCMKYPITSLESGDGCCPMGADANSDNDCSAVCGNGLIEMGETCDPIASCPTAMACTSTNACLKAVIAGDAASCTATCTIQPIEACVAGDGCCPAACTHDTDSDCSASCGNGDVEMSAGETCEPLSATEPCPTSCDDGVACTGDYSTGSVRNCSLACTHVEIALPLIGDGCCPPGANANNDNDCQAICGNGSVERGERCDGHCPTQDDCNDGNPCTNDAVAGSGCSVMCTHTPINTAVAGDNCCPAGANANNDGDCQPACGNRVREAGELCDGDCPTTAASCTDDTNVCTVNAVVGTGCQRECRNQQALAGAADGCCLDPKTMSSSTDPDCPGSCGNMKLDEGESCDPCPTTCADTNACTKDELTGPDLCNMQCTHTPLTGTGPDGCCHDGDTSADDPDCSNEPVCGNGRTEQGEECDGDCPQCVAPNSCTESKHVAPCRKECVETAIVASGPKIDRCCPMGSNQKEDADCDPVCGNKVVETGETCDPCDPCVDDDTNPCTVVTPTGSGCNLKCDRKTITSPRAGDSCCPPGANANNDSDCKPRCGNGETESGEQCDEVSTTCSMCRKVP